MDADVVQLEALRDVDLEHASKQTQGFRGYLVPELVFGTALCLAEMVEFLALSRLGLIPRRVAYQQHKQHNGTTPDVRDVGIVAKLSLAMLPLLIRVTDLDDLGGNVRWTAAHQAAHLGVSSLGVEEGRSKAKVGQFQVTVGRQQHVLGLDIPVGDTLSMAPGDGVDELLEVKVGNVFSYSFVGLDFVKQVAAFGQLHGNPDP